MVKSGNEISALLTTRPRGPLNCQICCTYCKFGNIHENFVFTNTGLGSSVGRVSALRSGGTGFKSGPRFVSDLVENHIVGFATTRLIYSHASLLHQSVLYEYIGCMVYRSTSL